MKTREELIEVMHYAYQDCLCKKDGTSGDAWSEAFDALLKEIPCYMEGYMSQNSLWLQKLKAMERKSTLSIAQP